MTDTTSALLRTHRENFIRFSQVLATDLTPYERKYVEERMAEERIAIASLITAEASLTSQTGDNKSGDPGMKRHRNHEGERHLARLEGQVIRQAETVERLQAEGHRCPDAQRQLEGLKEAIALLK